MDGRRALTLTLTLGLLLPLPGPGLADDAADELARFQGTWQVVGSERAGVKGPEDAVRQLNLTLTVSGRQFVYKAPDQTLLEGTFTLDPARKHLDCQGTTPQGRAVSLLGLYAFEGDTLKICFHETERPAEFKTAAGTKFVITTYKKKK